MDGDQYQPEFLALNPFHRVPVLVDEGFRVVESLAILDYLEAKYPTPALMPTDAKAVANVRMVEMVTANELMPAILPMSYQMLGMAEQDPQKLEQGKQQAVTVLSFFESLLSDRPYFAGEQLTLAEVVAGTVVPHLPSLGISLADYPKLSAWCERLMERAAWATTHISLEQMKAAIAQRQPQ
jgi:glutathione S-transferase